MLYVKSVEVSQVCRMGHGPDRPLRGKKGRGREQGILRHCRETHVAKYATYHNPNPTDEPMPIHIAVLYLAIVRASIKRTLMDEGHDHSVISVMEREYHRSDRERRAKQVERRESR